jgi:hypothetical protein
MPVHGGNFSQIYRIRIYKVFLVNKLAFLKFLTQQCTMINFENLKAEEWLQGKQMILLNEY